MKSYFEFKNDTMKIKSLYVQRKLLNPEKLIKWCEDNMDCAHLDPKDFHVTIAYSKEEVDWNQFEPERETLKVKVNSKPERLGDKGAIVLHFESEALQDRWREFKKGGASWDYDNYNPHVTVTYSFTGNNKDLKKVKAFKGTFEFGPEVFEEVNDEWTDSIKEIEMKGNDKDD